MLTNPKKLIKRQTVFATRTDDGEYFATVAEPFVFREEAKERVSRLVFEVRIESTISSSSSSQARRISAISFELACWPRFLPPLLVVDDDNLAIFQVPERSRSRIDFYQLKRNWKFEIWTLRSILHVVQKKTTIHPLFTSHGTPLFLGSHFRQSQDVPTNTQMYGTPYLPYDIYFHYFGWFFIICGGYIIIRGDLFIIFGS